MIRDSQSYVNKEEIKTLYKIVDKLEQRISTLEKTTPKKEESNQLEFPFPELRNNV